MNFLSRDFLYHRELSKTTYRKGSGVLEARTPDPLSNVRRLASLCLGFQPRTNAMVRGQPYFAWKRISDRG